MKNEREKLRIPGKKPTAFLFLPQTAQKRRYCPINSHLYHYAGNNPVKYIDPDGHWILNTNQFFPQKYYQNDTRWADHKMSGFNKTIGQIGCAITAMANGLNALENYVGLLTDGKERLGLNPDFVNINMTTEGVGANFEKLAQFITSDLGLKTTLRDTKDYEQVKTAVSSDKATLIFGHMQTQGTEGEHWININGINSGGSYNGSDVMSNGKNKPMNDYSQSDTRSFDRFIIIEVDIE